MLKWGGSICVAFLLMSCSVSLGWEYRFHGDDYNLGARRGVFSYSRYFGAPAHIRALRTRDAAWFGTWKWEAQRWDRTTNLTVTQWRWRLGLFAPRINRFTYQDPSFLLVQPVRQIAYVLPCWVPIAIVAVPTAVLWWLDRRRYSPGHCQKCGYDLTGNVSGVCPECGEPL